MTELTLESFKNTLDALMVSNPHARNKGDVFKDWCMENFGIEARISHIREQRQTTNRVSEQFRYFNPIVVFVCDSSVKRDGVIKYVMERTYSQLSVIAIVGVSPKAESSEGGFSYSFEKLLVFRRNVFSEWAEPFFDEVEDVKMLPSEGKKTKIDTGFLQTIFYGAPGTGKTRYVQEEIFANYSADNRFFTTFHQSYSYEDFVEGLKPVLDKGGKEIEYQMEQGVFYKACETAAKLAGYSTLKDCIEDSNEGREDKFNAALEENKTVLLCIDEINRGNVASIFGDLISLIEPSKRLGAGSYEMIVTLPYSKSLFGVPANLFIVGTMNTADRSIQLLDSALRRRFQFHELTPDYSVFQNENAATILKRINARIRSVLNKDNQIGHSYLMNALTNKEIVDSIINNIIPLLEEYFYNEIGKVRFILNEDGNTKYPFYIEDADAKEAYQAYISIEDIEEEDKSFYVVDGEIAHKSEEECGNYLKHLLGEDE